jgi:uracil-DNA glycosylase
MIIGQAPGPRTDHREPLSGASGRRLAALCGLPLSVFLARFERVNLVRRHPGKLAKGDAFPRAIARRNAARLLPLMRGRRVVLLGRNVADAFGLAHLSMFVWHRVGGVEVAVAPHPSGVNHWWNDPRNVRRARRFWRKLARWNQQSTAGRSTTSSRPTSSSAGSPTL